MTGDVLPEVIPPRMTTVDQVESELRRLWHDLAAGQERQTQQPVMRACVLNLIVYADGEEQAARLTNIVASLVTDYPSRTILWIAEPEKAPAEGNLQTWVTAHCEMPGTGSQQVCCEQISILAEGDQVRQLDVASAPLLIPDLPVVVWWPSDPVSRMDLFNRIRLRADRVLLDSFTFTDPLGRLAELAPLAGERYRAALGDFNWTRLTSWREILAQFYDVATWREHLDHLCELRLSYSSPDSGRPNPVQALLLAGWLMARLGWTLASEFQVESEGSWSCRLRRDGGELTLCLAAVESDARPGQLVRVDIACQDDLPAYFSIEWACKPDCLVTSVQIGDGAPITGTTHRGPTDDTSLLSEELSMIRRDRSYELALQAAGNLATRKRPKSAEER